MAEKSKVVDTLRELADTCRDGEKGFKEAAEHTKAADLKALFLDRSSERGRFANQLETELSRFGESGKKQDGHVTAAVHRAWISLKENLGAGDHSILDSLEQGEDYAKEQYQKAMQPGLPQEILSIVTQQSQAVFLSHDQIKALRDRKAA